MTAGNDSFVLGLDVGGTQVRVALARGGQMLAHRAAAWPSGLSPAGDAAFIAEMALSLAADAGVNGAFRAAGVSLAARVDRDGTVVQWPNRPTWRGLAIRSLLEARLGVPVAIEDDANAAAMAEWSLGAGRGYRHLLVVTVGTGIGAGLILNGQLFRGQHGWAGEFGHTVVQPGGPVCACGRGGCLQAVASGRTLDQVAAARQLSGARAVTEAAGRDEPWAREALSACGRWLGLGIANAVNLLDLEAAVIGGGLSVLEAPWWPAVEEALNANLLDAQHHRVALHRAAFQDTAGVLGAISLAGQELSKVA
ncbi:MAG: ROK family protein [Chloroflexota bacterium]